MLAMWRLEVALALTGWFNVPRSPNILLTAEGRAKIADAGALECAAHSILRAFTSICLVQFTP